MRQRPLITLCRFLRIVPNKKVGDEVKGASLFATTFCPDFSGILKRKLSLPAIKPMVLTRFRK